MKRLDNPYSWMNDKLKISLSKTEGSGVFAKEDINNGETLVVQGGRILHISEIEASTENMELAYVGFQISNEFYIFPNKNKEQTVLDGIFKINHSCDPNAGFKDCLTLIAMRNIKAGEEITFDYAMCDIELPNEEPWEPMNCDCKSKYCRRIITGSDWKNKEIIEKYQGFFSPYVANAIAELKKNS